MLHFLDRPVYLKIFLNVVLIDVHNATATEVRVLAVLYSNLLIIEVSMLNPLYRIL